MQYGCWRGATVLGVIGLAFLVQAGVSATPCCAQTTVFIVRHAEKGGMPVNNQRLTEAGLVRARVLAQMLRSVQLTVVLSSEFERTLETVRPTAEAQGLEVTRHRARDTGGLAKRILTEFAGQTLLVAGHSDTIPALLTELGVKEADVPKIGHDEFDNLFVLFIGKGGDVMLHRLRYGAASKPETPAGSTSDAAKEPAGK